MSFDAPRAAIRWQHRRPYLCRMRANGEPCGLLFFASARERNAHEEHLHGWREVTGEAAVGNAGDELRLLSDGTLFVETPMRKERRLAAAAAAAAAAAPAPKPQVGPIPPFGERDSLRAFRGGMYLGAAIASVVLVGAYLGWRVLW